MVKGRKEYTFFWRIENYSHCWHKNGKRLDSLSFTVDELEGTTWHLQMYPRGTDDEDVGYVSLFLTRSERDDGPKNISLRFELSALAADGSAFYVQEFQQEFTKGDNNGYGYGQLIETDEILLKRKSEYLPQDTLTVCCKMWKGDGDVCSIGQSWARTRVRVEQNSFLHVVENFSKLQPNVKQTMKVPSHSRKGRYISISLYITGEKIMIEIGLSDNDRVLYKCELSLLDGSGNTIECGEIDNHYEATRETVYTLPLSLTRDEILRRKIDYLPGDKLSLICKCTFSSGIELQTIEETFNEVPLDVIKKQCSYVPGETASCKASEKSSVYPSALEDMKALYVNQCMTDVELKTETKSFRAHKIILCARSPVFKTMLTSDMKEKNTDRICVDDLENDIVQQLLLFLYSDDVENLQWENATQLYYAADKYQIDKLKEVCSSFLVENLTTANAGDLLLLADTHNDGDLKKLVEDFILEHDEEIFGSREWDKVAKANPLLAVEIMQLKYRRKN